MARFIGSSLHTDNWGEDYLIQKLIEYFDDTYVIYRNKMVYGTQFDVCLLAPGLGIIIFEVKAWRPETILRVENGDSIVIKTTNKETNVEEEVKENPIDQVRGYVWKLSEKIHQKTGKNPLVLGMVCFPNLGKEDFDKKGIDSVCEYEETLLKEDLESKAAFYDKLNLFIKNHSANAKQKDPFSPELMYRIMQMLGLDLKLEDPSIENTDIVENTVGPVKTSYSILSFIPHDEKALNRIKEMLNAYSLGTKLYLFVENASELDNIKQAIGKTLNQKGLSSEGSNLKINFTENKNIKGPQSNTSFNIFNCAVYLVPQLGKQYGYFKITDGEIPNDIENALKIADKYSDFNLEQYRIEHCDTNKNIIVKAGAGTGKTYTMISRIAFICYSQSCMMKDMVNRIVMLTFTDEAAEQMKEKVKEYFYNYYLLSRNTDCLEFINQMDRMQISTIHSYAKKIISMLGIEKGYGAEISVAGGDYKLKQIIAEIVDKYIVQMQKRHGKDYVKRLGMPIYKINDSVFELISKMHNQSINVEDLELKNFGVSITEGYEELHKLFSIVIPEVERVATAAYKQEDKVYLSSMMTVLAILLDNEENRQRLIRMQTGRPQFMFVDEFQDTDDVQIEALMKIVELLQYKLFVVGDVKQCIYRFRGAKENAFEKLDYKDKTSWATFSLTKNYRTDHTLLDIFHNTFAKMGATDVGGEQLLIYNSENEENNDRLIGVQSFNKNSPVNYYYRKITVNNEGERLIALFDEINRQKEIIKNIELQSEVVLKEEDKTVAILVRENWQAEEIKRQGKARGIEILTNTAGDLYSTDAALEMLTLVNALLHYDEPQYLYAFISSNFIHENVAKAKLYEIRENEKRSWKKTDNAKLDLVRELHAIINNKILTQEKNNWNDWIDVVKALRTTPVLQVLRQIYLAFEPWIHYGKGNRDLQNNYRLNVDLLFEEMINSANIDSLSINTLADILTANILSQKNVNSRNVDTENSDFIIRCMTVHKAKGLEYGAIILPYCSAPIDKMKRSDTNVTVRDDNMIKIGYQIKLDQDSTITKIQNDFFDETLEKNERYREEGRILYVAMTRAKRAFSWICLEKKKGPNWQDLIWEDN